MSSTQHYLTIALKAAQLASDYLLKNFGSIKPFKHKHDRHYGINSMPCPNTQPHLSHPQHLA